MPWHAVRGEALRSATHHHIPTLGEHPRIDEARVANDIFARCLMNMARDAQVRLIRFDKAAHTVTAHMQAGVNAVNRRPIRWTVRYEEV